MEGAKLFVLSPKDNYEEVTSKSNHLMTFKKFPS